jgi:hypothetical protein
MKLHLTLFLAHPEYFSDSLLPNQPSSPTQLSAKHGGKSLVGSKLLDQGEIIGNHIGTF